MPQPLTRFEKRVAWKRSIVNARRNKPIQHGIWRVDMSPRSKLLLTVALSLIALFVSGCGHRRAELIAAACPAPPLLPSALKAESPLLTLNWDELILKQFPQ